MSEPRAAQVEVNGLSIHYLDWGGAGPPIVLLHGLASTAHIWDLVAPRLAATHRVVALDQRGHGRSAKPEAGYDFASMGTDLRGVLDALGLQQPLLVGHSWGASVALYAAATWPEEVRGLALVDGGVGDLQARYTWEEAERAMAPPDLTTHTPDALLARVQAGDLGRCWSPAVERAFLAIFEVTPAGTVRPWLSRANHLRILRALWELRPSTLYSAVRCPVLLAPAFRANDPRGPDWVATRRAQVAAAATTLPRAEVVWFPDTIHDIPLHCPAELAAALTRFAARR